VQHIWIKVTFEYYLLQLILDFVEKNKAVLSEEAGAGKVLESDRFLQYLHKMLVVEF
jgi:hypothetical protein